MIHSSDDADHPAQKHTNQPSMGRLLVLISPFNECGTLVRAGQQLALQQGIDWQVVWVDTGRIVKRQASLDLQSAFSLARELGAQTLTLRGPSHALTLTPFIEQYGINNVLLGAGRNRSLRFWRKPLYQQLIESGLVLQVLVVSSANTAKVKLNTKELNKAVNSIDGNHFNVTDINVTHNLHKFKNSFRQAAQHEIDRVWSWRNTAFAALAVLLSTLVAIPLERLISSANLVLIYVLAVIAAGLQYGWRTAVTASLFAFLCFNFFLTEPRYTLHVTRQDELATLVFLLIIALACGPAASRIRRQFLLLHDANRYSEAMRLLGQELSVAKDSNAIWQAMHKVISETVGADCLIVPAGDGYNAWPNPNQPFTADDKIAIDWARQCQPMAESFSNKTVANWSVFALHKDQHTIACLLVRPLEATSLLSLNDKALIAAISHQAADTWLRIQLASELEAARVKTEVEQLRSALLSSVSHDLKSPLAAMMGAAESLRLLDQQLDSQDRYELMDTLVQESRRLDSYIQNLLDMTRLGYGTLKIERDWVAMTDIIGSALSRLKRYYPSIKTETHFAATPVLYVHAALIEQALFNILENAARFTPPDENICITMKTHNDQSDQKKQGLQNKPQCIIAIEDKGPGIPEALREKIFDMFFGIAEGDQKKQNTGMGLAICRGMIGAHGGSVIATSGHISQTAQTAQTAQISDAKGTIFIVKLPLDTPPISTSAAEEST